MAGTPVEYTDGSFSKFSAQTKTGDHAYNDGAMDRFRQAHWNGSESNPSYTVYAPLEPPSAIPPAKPGIRDDVRFAKLDSYVKEQRNNFNTPPEELEDRVARAMGLKSVKDLPPDIKNRIEGDCNPQPQILPKVELHNPSPEDLAARDSFAKSIDSDPRYNGIRDWVAGLPKGSKIDPELIVKTLDSSRHLSAEERYAVFSACGRPNDFFTNDPEGVKMEQKFEHKQGS